SESPKEIPVIRNPDKMKKRSTPSQPCRIATITNPGIRRNVPSGVGQPSTKCATSTIHMAIALMPSSSCMRHGSLGDAATFLDGSAVFRTPTYALHVAVWLVKMTSLCFVSDGIEESQFASARNPPACIRSVNQGHRL